MCAFLKCRPMKVLACLVTLLTFFPAAVGACDFVEPVGRSPGQMRQRTDLAAVGEPQHDAEGSCGGLRTDLSLLTEKEMSGIKGGQSEAATMVAAADQLRSAGRLVEAFQAYLNVLDVYPREVDLERVYDAMRDTGGEMDAAQQAALESQLPSVDTLRTPEAKYAIEDYYFVAGIHATKAGDGQRAHDYFSSCKDVAWKLMYENQNSPIQTYITYNYFAAAQFQGPDEARAACEDLEGFIRDQSPCMARCAARLAVADFKATPERNSCETFLHYASVLAERTYGFIDAALEDPALDKETKAWIEYGLGTAYFGTNQFGEALAHYERILELYPEAGEPTLYAAFGVALAKQQLYSYAPSAVIQAFQDFLEDYGDSQFADDALMKIGNAYSGMEDFTSAAQAYTQVITNYPESNAAPLAEGALAFLMEHMMSAVELTTAYLEQKEENGELLAQMCGPVALHMLLETEGVKSTVEELARLAGTDKTGTTMLGLVKAARAKGIELVGVQADGYESLSAPFIAHVNDNHFVLVTDVNGRGVVVAEPGKFVQTIPAVLFAKQWDGKALVTADTKGVAELLQVAALKGAKGGWSPPLPDKISEYVPCRYGNWTCCANDGGAGETLSFPYSNAGGPPAGPPRATLAQAPPGAGMPRRLGNQFPDISSGTEAPGVHLSVNPFNSSVSVAETDVAFGSSGPMTVHFTRYYANQWGKERLYFQTGGAPWQVMGEDWTHSLNVHIREAEEGPDGYPLALSVVDEFGVARSYYLADVSEGSTTYTRTGSGNAATWETAFYVTRSRSEPKQLTLWCPTGLAYWFSAADDLGDHPFARLEKIVDATGNQIGLTYDDPDVSVGKLIQIVAGSDPRQIDLEYDETWHRIKKVSLKCGPLTFQTVEYEYVGGRLAKVIYDGAVDSPIEYGYSSWVPGSICLSDVWDRMGNHTTLEWGYTEGVGTTVTVTAPDGLVTEYARSPGSSVAMVTNWDGQEPVRKVRYTPRDAETNGYDIRYVDFFVNDTEYERWRYEYDPTNRDLIEIWAPGGKRYATYSYTDLGRLATSAAGDDDPTVWTYPQDPRALYPMKRTDPDGTETDYDYDMWQRLVRIVYPWGGEDGVDVDYDDCGDIESVTDPLGHQWSYWYDEMGNLTTVLGPELEHTTMQHDGFGNVIKVTQWVGGEEGPSTEYEYASGGCPCGGGALLTKITDALENETTFDHDLNGNVVRVTDALERKTKYTYDVMNRLVEIESPEGSGNTMTFYYDKLGYMVGSVDFNDTGAFYFYDHMGRLTSVVDGIGPVSYEYDAFGNLTKVVDGEQHETSFEYSAANRLTKVTDAEGKIVKYVYVAGRLVQKGAGPDGDIDPTQYIYSMGTSGTGLLIEVRYNRGQEVDTAGFTYDDAARLVSMTDWLGTIGYEYDDSNRLTKITDYDDLTLRYTYDGLGNVLTMKDYFGKTIGYTYTARNQLDTINAYGVKTWDFDYNELGQRKEELLPNGLKTYYDYDGRNRLTGISLKDGGAVKMGFAYDLDDMGNIMETTKHDGSYWAYDYDLRYRLTTAGAYNASQQLVNSYGYAYDDAGNRLTKVVDGTTYAYEYDDANELTKETVGGTDTMYEYDAYGRLTRKYQGDPGNPTYVSGYEWRYGDKLAGYLSNFPGESGAVTYDYGGDGKRRKRTEGGNTTTYYWDAGWNQINYKTQSGSKFTWVRDPASAGTRLMAKWNGTNPSSALWRYYSQDNIGSTRMGTNDGKTTIKTYDYTPYGEMYSESGWAHTNFRFTGAFWDTTTQMYYFPFRMYSPSLGRWMTRDPVHLIAGVNHYWYCMNRPVSYFDLLGLEPYPGGWWNPGNWLRGLYTGDPSAPDDVYSVAIGAAAEYTANLGAAWRRSVEQLDVFVPFVVLDVPAFVFSSIDVAIAWDTTVPWYKALGAEALNVIGLFGQVPLLQWWAAIGLDAIVFEGVDDFLDPGYPCPYDEPQPDLYY